MILVSGNQSGDLDSLVSTYVKSELLRIDGHFREDVLSLFHFPRMRWKLRAEAIYLFEQTETDFEYIIFTDELKLIDLEGFFRKDLLQIVLVDHNNPERELKLYKDSIIEIIDHHAESSSPMGDIKRTIAPTGSCSTLVGEQFLKLLAEKPDLFSESKIRQLSTLLYSAIRMDTDHLENNPLYDLLRDYTILEGLKAMTDADEVFIRELKFRKYDQSSYTDEDHLYKDYKQWVSSGISYGISTVFFNSGEIPEGAVENFIKNENIDILFLMHFLKEPILKRELTVAFDGSFHYKKELLKRLSDSPVFERLNRRSFSQVNRDLSRKKIQPVIDELLKELQEKL